MKERYKQTESGVIPEDWNIKELNSLSNIIDSLHQTPPFVDFGYAMVRATEIKTGNLNLEKASRVDEKTYAKFTRKYRPVKGDIVLSRVGTYIGVSSFVDTNEPFCMGQNTVVIHPLIVGKFLYYILNSKNVREQIDNETFWTSGQKSLSLKSIRELKLTVPNTDPEQSNIARILTDVDNLIESLNRFIEKKINIKQGAMQTLLTGKRRPPGFDNQWAIKKLGEMLDYEQPSKYIIENSEYNDKGEIPVLTANKAFILGYTNEKEGIYSDLPVIIFDDFTTDSKYVDFPFKVKSSAIKILKAKPAYNLRFVFGKIQLIRFSLGGHKRYYISEYQHLPISIPEDLEEQNAIAKVLSEMTGEIEMLKQEREKYMQLKRGIMQQLLTGSIRLKWKS